MLLTTNTSVLENLISIANSSDVSNNHEDDYIDSDGLLCCGICHTRRQLKVGERIVWCICKCQEKNQEEAKIQEVNRQILIKKNRCFSHSEMFNWTFENDNHIQPKINICQRYAENWNKARENNTGMILIGDVSTGKSYAAACVANRLCEQGVSAKFINFSEILNDLQCSLDRNEYVRSLTNYSLLVIDDFGTERDTQYAMEQIFNVIDNRIRSGKPFIITTNLSLDDLKSTTDLEKKRVYSRILSVCVPILFEGNSLRIQEAKNKRDIFSSFLLS